MKLFVWILAVVFVTACDNSESVAGGLDDVKNDNPQETTQGGALLLKEKTQTGTTIYSYSQGNKLSSTLYKSNEREDIRVNYKYVGDKIVERISQSEAEGQPEFKTVYEYGGDLVTSVLEYCDGELRSKRRYVYNDKNELVKRIFSFKNKKGKFEETENAIERIADGKTVKWIVNKDEYRTYEFDNKKNPYSGILGYDKILMIEQMGFTNNIISWKIYTNGKLDFEDKSEFKYSKSANAPVKESTNSVKSNREPFVVEYFYK